MPNFSHPSRVRAPRQSQKVSQPDSDSLQMIKTDGIDGLPLPHGPKPASLGAIISQFKSRVTKQI